MRIGIVVAAVFACVACGGTTNNNPGQSGSCTATLSGAITGTFDCKSATTVWSSTDDKGAFGFSTVQDGTTLTVAIGWPGEPTSTQYKSTDAGADGGVEVHTGSGAGTQAWTASAGGSGAATGSYNLSFSSISNTTSAGSAKAYSASGTLDATLDPATGQSGTVTLHITF